MDAADFMAVWIGEIAQIHWPHAAIAKARSVFDAGAAIGLVALVGPAFDAKLAARLLHCSRRNAQRVRRLRQRYARQAIEEVERDLDRLHLVFDGHAVGAVLDTINLGDVFHSKATAGTEAHLNLKRRIENFKPIAGISIEAEVFSDEDGNEFSDRKKGSLGIDILIKRNGKNVLGIDLKTGRGFSKKKRGKITERFGVPIVEIFIGVR